MSEKKTRFISLLQSEGKIRDEHLDRMAHYSQYDSKLSPDIGEESVIVTRGIVSLTNGESLYDYTHDDSTKYSEDINNLYLKGRYANAYHYDETDGVHSPELNSREVVSLTDGKGIYDYTHDGETEYSSDEIHNKYINGRYSNPYYYNEIHPANAYSVPYNTPTNESLTDGKDLYSYTHDGESRYSSEDIDAYYIDGILGRSYNYYETDVRNYTTPDSRNEVSRPKSLTDGKGIYDYTHDGRTKYSYDNIESYYINDILKKSYGYQETNIRSYNAPANRKEVRKPKSLTDGKGINDYTHDGESRYSKEITNIYFNGITKEKAYEVAGVKDGEVTTRWKGKYKEYITLKVDKNGKLNSGIGDDTKIFHDGYGDGQSDEIYSVGLKLYDSLSKFYSNAKYYVSHSRSVDGNSIIIGGAGFDGIDSEGIVDRVAERGRMSTRFFETKRIYNVYGEGDVPSNIGYVRSNELNEFSSYRHDINGENNLLKKTDELYNSHKIKTLFGRFHTSNEDGYNTYTESFDSAKIPYYGNPRGRGLFKLGVPNGALYETNGYNNPYCRAWTYHHQYSKISDMMRSFKKREDNNNTYMSIPLAYRSRIHGLDSGDKYLRDNSVLQESGFVRITPSISEYNSDKDTFVSFDGTKGAVNLKKYMFSLENLAWNDGSSNNRRNLSMEQIGPNNGRIMWFPPYNLDFKESVNVKWNQQEFIGRGENIYTYSNTTRKGTLSFTLLIDHPSILNSLGNGEYSGEEPDMDVEGDILRFFAGCQIPEPDPDAKANPPEDVRKERKNKKDDSKVSVIPDTEIFENSGSVEPAVDTGEPTTDIVNENGSIVFYVFFPNNYSGMWNGGDNLSGIESDSAGKSKGLDMFKSSGPTDRNWYEYLLFGHNATVYEPIKKPKGVNIEVLQCDDTKNLNGNRWLIYGYKDSANNKTIVIPSKFTNEFKPNKKLLEYIFGSDYNNSDNLNKLANAINFAIKGTPYEVNGVKIMRDSSISDYEIDFIGDGFEMGNNPISTGEKGEFGSFEYIIAHKTAGVEQADFFSKLNSDASLLSPLKEKRFKYMVDYDLRQGGIVKGSMYDGNAYHLNSSVKKVSKEKNDEEVNYSFSEVFTVVYGKERRLGTDDPVYIALKERTISLSDEKDECRKRIEKLEAIFGGDGVQFESTEAFGAATMQDSNNTTTLSVRRCYTVLNTLKNITGSKVNTQSPDDKNEVLKNKNGNNSIEAKKGRYTKIVIKYNVPNETKNGVDVVEDTPAEEPEVNSTYRTGLNVPNESVDRSEGGIDVVYDTDDSITYNPADRRYDDEYRFFRRLKEDSPLIYKKISDKVKYFDPAFHSMSPEGFNARLTFLQQCTRQGHTLSASENSNQVCATTAGNLSFGKMPVCVLRIGDFINTRIIIESMTIDYKNGESMQWDLNPEGVGVQPMYANVSLNITLLGGQSLEAPVNRLQNAITFNYYANAPVYDDRADRVRNNYDGTIQYTHLFRPFNEGER